MMVVWLFLVHVFLLFYMSLSSESVYNLSNETDRVALLSFKDRITGDSLGALSSWNDSLHFCNWQGVGCSRRHYRVISLDLSSQSLVGSISPYVANLTFLRTINLSNNNLYGVIPQEFGHLFRLQYLNLSLNSFGGEIPANLTLCSELRVVGLSFNEIVGRIPVELSHLPKLREFGAFANMLTGIIPPSLGNISTLERLSIGRNGLEGRIPSDLGQIARLKFVQISQNNLSGTIPSSLYNLSSLYLLSLAQNKLHGNLLPELGLLLPNLQMLYVGTNQFTGSIPPSISNASGLVQLYFTYNYFTGSVPENLGNLRDLQRLNFGGNLLGTKEADDFDFLISLTNCSRLELLSLFDNQLSGILPHSIANLSSELTRVDMGGNYMFGSIPSGISNLANLIELGLEQNLLRGAIPTELGKLHKLQRLFLLKNRLSGPIPSSLGNITWLDTLNLYGNGLEGSIPPSLGNCQHLKGMDLSQNNLHGTIPKQVIRISSLSIYLDLSRNSFTGLLPIEVGNLINLRYLDIAMNKLSGEIPRTLGQCLSLEHLHMEGNMFQGPIPPSLSTLKGIQDLDLSHNNFSGKIPEYLGKFLFLHYLNLSYNDFEGEVPKEGILTNLSAMSIFGNNKLCGGISILQLPACPVLASEKRARHRVLKVVIAVISVAISLSLLLCLFVALHWRKKSRNMPSLPNSLEDQHLKVSYKDISKATEGFSSTNLIGVGRYGSVYRGILDHIEQVVAVKVLHNQEPGASDTFLAECKALRNVRHRNIVKILTSCSSIDFNGYEFKALLFEFMPNGSLEKWLHPEVDGIHSFGQLNFIQRLDVAIEVASALDHLHNYCPEPIVHCDLKPSNVLLDGDMSAHLCDFGLAKFIKKSSSGSLQDQTNSIGVRGTVGYVPPEYGMGGMLSTLGDVYSYGILLLEMFTGKRPTDEMFKDGINLHELAKVAWPKRVMEIIDPLLQKETPGEPFVKMRSRIQDCMISVLGIGISCSTESPRKRMEMKDVILEIHAVKDMFMRDEFQRE